MQEFGGGWSHKNYLTQLDNISGRKRSMAMKLLVQGHTVHYRGGGLRERKMQGEYSYLQFTDFKIQFKQESLTSAYF